MSFTFFLSNKNILTFNSIEELTNYINDEITNFSEAIFNFKDNKLYLGFSETIETDYYIGFPNKNELVNFCTSFCTQEIEELFTTNEIFISPTIIDIAVFINRWLKLANTKGKITDFIIENIKIRDNTFYIFTYKIKINIPKKYQNKDEIYRNIRMLVLLKKQLSSEEWKLAAEEIKNWDITESFQKDLMDKSKYDFIRDFR